MHNFVHIQIKVTDFTIAKEFYSKNFNWHIYSPAEMDNVLFYRVDKLEEQVGGSFLLVDKIPPESSILLYINSSNITESLKKIEQTGGETILPATPLPGEEGFIGRFKDPFGNVMGLWSESKS